MNLRSLLLAAACVGSSGCATVTLYEPMSALQRPVLVHPAADNFSGTRILLRCLSNDDLPTGDADKVCRNLATTLQRQGAVCESIVPRGQDDARSASLFEGAGPDLIIELDAKTEHHADYPLLGLVSVISLTMVPSVEEHTYKQEIVVRGRDRSVLVSDVFRARFVEYTGLLVWSLNGIADLFLRDDDNDLGGDAAKKDFSRDFYQQSAQLAFNARVRSELLGLTTPRSPSKD
jgi:hypothetical protein